MDVNLTGLWITNYKMKKVPQLSKTLKAMHQRKDPQKVYRHTTAE